MFLFTAHQKYLETLTLTNAFSNTAPPENVRLLDYPEFSAGLKAAINNGKWICIYIALF